MSCTWSVSVWAVRPPLPPSHPARLPRMQKWCIKAPGREITKLLSLSLFPKLLYMMAQSILRNTKSHPWYSWYFTSKSLKKQSNFSKYSKASTSSNIGGKSRNLPHHTSSANSAPPLFGLWRDPPPELWISRGQEQHAEPQRSTVENESNWAGNVATWFLRDSKALANQPVTGPMVFLIILLVFWQ